MTPHDALEPQSSPTGLGARGYELALIAGGLWAAFNASIGYVLLFNPETSQTTAANVVVAAGALSFFAGVLALALSAAVRSTRPRARAPGGCCLSSVWSWQVLRCS